MSNETNSLYYYSENNEVLGPFTIQELEGKINPDSLVFNDSGTKWVKASDVPEISDLLFVEPSNEPIAFTSDDFSSIDITSDDVREEGIDTAVVSEPELISEPDQGGSNSLKTIIIIFVVLGLIGGGVYTFLKSDYYKWKNAAKMYCYIPSLKIRSDTTTFSDYNVLPIALGYGESVLVLNNPELSPWVNVKIGTTQGLVNSSFLMSENDFMILASLLDTESKQKQVSTSKHRKSLVSHVAYQSTLNSLPVQSWSIVDIDNNNFIKTRKSYYTSNEYAIYILKNGTYEELTIFVYNDRNEISKKSYTDLANLEVDDVNDYLRQFDLRY
jgi:hypothetical protein